MIKIDNIEVFGWKMAIAGCRNPMNSREKSDSAFFAGFDFNRDYYFRDINGKRRDWQYWLPSSEEEPSKRDVKKWSEWHKRRKAWEQEAFPKPYHDDENGGCRIGDVLIGPNDHKLLMNLCKGGTEEAKWRRMVHVQMDVTAPLYWWKEFETYKVGTVSNSCSTMHKIQAKEFTLEDFSCEHLNFFSKNALDVSIKQLNWCRETFNTPDDQLDMDILKKLGCETKKDLWYQMIQLLPTSYNQRRTIDLNYEILAAQYRQRKDHKLDEWREYCAWIRSLPYSEFITMEENNDDSV